CTRELRMIVAEANRLGNLVDGISSSEKQVLGAHHALIQNHPLPARVVPRQRSLHAALRVVAVVDEVGQRYPLAIMLLDITLGGVMDLTVEVRRAGAMPHRGMLTLRHFSTASAAANSAAACSRA